MTKRQVFYSFHYAKDVARVQMIRNIGAIEDNKPVSPNEWETVKRGGELAIKKWIDENMKYKSCLVVLVGEETSSRKWVEYEIIKAWNSGMGVVGIYIHNLKSFNTGICRKGKNPFDSIKFDSGESLSKYVECYDPKSWDAYNDIRLNIEKWIEKAISDRK